MSLLATESGAFLGIFFLLVMIVGLVGTVALWFFVMRNAPPDGSDTGVVSDDPEADRHGP